MIFERQDRGALRLRSTFSGFAPFVGGATGESVGRRGRSSWRVGALARFVSRAEARRIHRVDALATDFALVVGQVVRSVRATVSVIRVCSGLRRVRRWIHVQGTKTPHGSIPGHDRTSFLTFDDAGRIVRRESYDCYQPLSG